VTELSAAGFPLVCECLIDQGRRIGGDPVGHACGRRATRPHPGGFLVCDDCDARLAAGSPRVTPPPHPRGLTGQWGMVRDFLA
jgi:hypothetical protein